MRNTATEVLQKHGFARSARNYVELLNRTASGVPLTPSCAASDRRADAEQPSSNAREASSDDGKVERQWACAEDEIGAHPVPQYFIQAIEIFSLSGES